MVRKNNWLCSSVLAAGLCVPTFAQAYQLEMNTALLQAMDKITGRVSEIEVPVNGEVKFGSFSIVVRACKATPPEETPENYAFVDVADTTKDGKLFNIFKGWMMSSSPALNAVEHPIYDVWLLKCINKSVNKEKLLSPELLLERDGLPKKEDIMQDETPSKEAIKAEEALAEAKAQQDDQTNSEEVKAEEKAKDVSEASDLSEVKPSEQTQSQNNDLISQEDKLPIVPEIKDTKVLEEVAEPALAIEKEEKSGNGEPVMENETSNTPQPLLPNLSSDDNAPQPLINFGVDTPSEPKDKSASEEVNTANNKDIPAETEENQPNMSDKEQAQEVVAPIVISNTDTVVDEQKNMDNSSQELDVPAQIPTEESDIPVEEDQFIEEDTVTQ